MHSGHSSRLCACCAGKRFGNSPQDFTLHEDVNIETDLAASDYDGVILVLYPDEKHVPVPPAIVNFIHNVAGIDKKIHKAPTLWRCDEVAGKRLVISPTGSISPYHDSTVIKEAASVGMLRAIDAGFKQPLLIVQEVAGFPEAQLVVILGALEVLYVPLQIYERGGQRSVNRIGLYGGDKVTEKFHEIADNAVNIEKSRILIRDIAGGDPERMCPANVVAYIKEAFSSVSSISVKIIEDDKTIAKDYPLLGAVGRAVSNVDKHKSRIVELEYKPDGGKVTETLMLVGKGVCYDTGGADLKIGGKMRGMSRDKCGAAFVAGFLKACSLMKPGHIKAVGVLCLCRNSIGSFSYVADELLVSRNGKTIRITNTDAEGRLAMADALTKAVENAPNETNPHLYTIATLTGHASLCFGEYTVAIDNHIARADNHASLLQFSASKMSEGVEVSVVRPIDLSVNDGKYKGDDLSQFDPDARGRNHQFAAGFLLRVSGLVEKNIKYTHLDIAGSCGWPPGQPTAVPLLTLCHAHKLLTFDYKSAR